MPDFKKYELNGLLYDRVTTILDSCPPKGLIDWKVRVGKAESGKVSRGALKIGSRVDELVEEDVRVGTYKLKKTDKAEVLSCMEAWEKWKVDWPGHHKEINETQKTVYHDDWAVAGTFDLASPKAIIDIKTSKRVSKTYWVQLAVYNRGLGREKWVLRLDKGVGDYEYVKCPEKYSQEYLEQVFVSMLNVYHFQKEEEKKL